MENFTIKSIYRVQLCPKLDDFGRPIDACFEHQDMFDFDKDGNCFVFVSDFVKFSEYIHLHFGALMYIRSVVHVSDNSFVYED